MRKIQFRTWLPIVFSLASVCLMAWGIYAQARCWTYDSGRPFWKCEAPDFFIELLSAPPVLLSRPLTNAIDNFPSYFPYLVELPLIFLWWWFLGTRLDFGLLGVGSYKYRRSWISPYSTLIVLLVALLSWSLGEDIQFFEKYSYLSVNPYLGAIADLRWLPLRLWLLILIVGLGLAALRLARGQTGRLDKKLVGARTLRLFALILGLYISGATVAVWHSKLLEQQRQAEYDLHRIVIKGRVLDGRGAPVYAIEVNLVPVLENGDVPEKDSAHDFTNENGEYTLAPEEAGRFMLGVQWNAPPSPMLPFLTRYYPDTVDPKQAEILQIPPARHMTMKPMRLPRISLVKVPVSVSWAGGKPEPEAFLLPINTQYPHSGVVGLEALHPENDGTISLPVGFDYEITAQVDCDGGAKIGNAFTPPVALSLKTVPATIAPMHFLLPGEPCRIWHPK
jgi:hypothetical protein